MKLYLMSAIIIFVNFALSTLISIPNSKAKFHYAIGSRAGLRPASELLSVMEYGLN